MNRYKKIGAILFFSFILLSMPLLLNRDIHIFDGEEVSKDFNVCDEQPLFGLKYQNCDSIECIKFHETIKAKIKEDCK